MDKPILDTRNLSKSYTIGKRTITVLDNIALSISSGQFVVFSILAGVLILVSSILSTRYVCPHAGGSLL